MLNQLSLSILFKLQYYTTLELLDSITLYQNNQIKKLKLKLIVYIVIELYKLLVEVILAFYNMLQD